MARQTGFDTFCNGVFHNLNIYLSSYFEDSIYTKKKEEAKTTPPSTQKQTKPAKQQNKIKLFYKINDCSSLFLATGRYYLFHGNEHHKYVSFDNSMHVIECLVAQKKINITEGPQIRKIPIVSIF